MPKMIISADWHIRATKPRCRVDNDWLETQRKAYIKGYKDNINGGWG